MISLSYFNLKYGKPLGKQIKIKFSTHFTVTGSQVYCRF